MIISEVSTWSVPSTSFSSSPFIIIRRYARCFVSGRPTDRDGNKLESPSSKSYAAGSVPYASYCVTYQKTQANL
jgi:hypothetical protein